MGESVFLVTLLTLLLVPIAPPVVAFWTFRAGKNGVFLTRSFLGVRLSIDGGMLTLRRIGMAELTFPIDRLRYIFVKIPGGGLDRPGLLLP